MDESTAINFSVENDFFLENTENQWENVINEFLNSPITSPHYNDMLSEINKYKQYIYEKYFYLSLNKNDVILLQNIFNESDISE